jgi:hypothetical protein
MRSLPVLPGGGKRVDLCKNDWNHHCSKDVSMIWQGITQAAQESLFRITKKNVSIRGAPAEQKTGDK